MTREAPHRAGRPAGERRVVTVPNAISVVRLACVPVFLVLLGDGHRVAAAILLGALGASDWIDGWIARRFGQVSTLGKVLDPTADRVLLLAGAVALLADGSLPVVVGVLALVREALVSAAVVALALRGARRIDVQWAGKAGTLALMFAFPLFLLGDAVNGGHALIRAAAWCFALVGLALGYYAALTYVPLARQALEDGRTAGPVGSVRP
jgi:cardiolipin synthase (CMP-forming)